MDAVAVVFDTETLERLYPAASWRDASADVRSVLEDDFDYRQGSVPFGDPDIGATDGIAIVEDMAGEFPWFTPSLKDIRTLRIEEDTDPMVVLDGKRRRAQRRRRSGA